MLAELLELAPGGVEQVDAPGRPRGRRRVRGLRRARASCPSSARSRLRAGDELVEVESREVPDDWAERWKRFYFPVLVAGRLYVRPPWERPAERGGVEEVVIDPGGAFGTGTHPTTRMCLELLLEARGRRIVLATSAAARACWRSRPRSWGSIRCWGWTPTAPLSTRRDRNARANYVEVEVRRADLRREPAPVADVVAANLTARLCEAVARGWAERDVRPGVLIASGFLREEADRVAAALAACGLEERRRMVSGDWAAILAS